MLQGFEINGKHLMLVLHFTTIWLNSNWCLVL